MQKPNFIMAVMLTLNSVLTIHDHKAAIVDIVLIVANPENQTSSSMRTPTSAKLLVVSDFIYQ
jgi:hypothetical protein